jgi:CTP synthase
LVEIAEIGDHPFYIGSQFHPEFKSRPLRPHPLFYGFARACGETLKQTADLKTEALRPEQGAAR